MSLTQQLLVRALIAHFWQSRTGTNSFRGEHSLHDRFMLPHFVQSRLGGRGRRSDAKPVTPFSSDWFAPHFEFRFPAIGSVTARGIHLELRHALEPWNVLGEEASGGGTARNVDSSVERLQVKVSGMIDSRFAVLVQWPAGSAASHRRRRRIRGRSALSRVAAALVPASQHPVHTPAGV